MSLWGGWILVLVTTSGLDEAKRIAKTLVEKKLAACINIVEKIHSVYWWQGKVEEGDESLLVIKTRVDKFKELVDTVKKLHSYTVPEIIALPIVVGSSDYLKWLDESVS
ncbi:divalent-cation tolerance protein CutA [Desulfurococcaceae archaeon MEX13E-LK6-19]|nr:divalent-cation tolerance protein CutA [Desulfurococcaceae archaeon MEX13E-LK6-19]